MGKQDYRVVNETGVPCIKCGKPTQTREHLFMREKHYKQPYYYSKWFNCINKDCNSTLFMREEDRVWNKNAAAQNIKLLEEDRENQQRILNF